MSVILGHKNLEKPLKATEVTRKFFICHHQDKIFINLI